MNSHTFDILRKFLEKHNADEREWDAIDALQEELEAYRNGGVTEEILRRNDGYIKVGRGCAITLAKPSEETPPCQPGEDPQ